MSGVWYDLVIEIRDVRQQFFEQRLPLVTLDDFFERRAILRDAARQNLWRTAVHGVPCFRRLNAQPRKFRHKFLHDKFKVF